MVAEPRVARRRGTGSGLQACSSARTGSRSARFVGWRGHAQALGSPVLPGRGRAAADRAHLAGERRSSRPTAALRVSRW